jgi:hypothetical protein
MELYLISTESAWINEPIKVVDIHILKKKNLFSTDYFLHIELEKSVPTFGLEQQGINPKMSANFIMSSRYIGESLNDLKQFPITVNIFIPKNNNYTEIKDKRNLIFYAIGSLYNNIKVAQEELSSSQSSFSNGRK